MQQLNVWLLGAHIGQLQYSNAQLSFHYRPEYLAEYLAAENPQPLSFALPLQAAPYTGSAVQAFFGGLLPEGRLRDLIARQQGASPKNDFSLLQVLGGECAGAVSLLPVDEVPPSQRDTSTYLTNHQLQAVLKTLPHRPMLAGQDGIRLSLAGAQDKLPVLYNGRAIALPADGAVSTHILKTPISGLHNTVQNEAFCLSLAGQVGIRAATPTIYSVDGQAVLLVQRYDRATSTSGNTLRLHQEDFCQALGVVADNKYQKEGGPSVADCFGLVKGATKPFAPQVLQLLDYLLFNCLIGNHDAHGKNYSLLYAQSAHLAPMYDVLCTAIYPSLTPKMAMKIGSQYDFENVFPRHWQQLAEEAGLNPNRLQKRLQHWAQVLPAAAKALYAEQFAGEDVAEEITAELTRRCNKTLSRCIA